MRDKAFNIAKNPKFKEYHRGLASIVYNFFDKKTSGTHAWSENLATQNSGWQWLLIWEYFKQKISWRSAETNNLKTGEKRNTLAFDNIWGAYLNYMLLMSKFNKGIRFYCVTDIYSKYAWVIPLKDKKDINY